MPSVAPAIVNSAMTPVASQTGTDITLRNGGGSDDGTAVWAELAAATGGPGTGVFDLTISGVTAGDRVEVGFTTACWDSANAWAMLNFASRVSGATVNYLYPTPASPGTFATGQGICIASANAFRQTVGSFMYTVLAGDLSSGSLTIRPVYKTILASNRTLSRSAGIPVIFSIKNLGH